MSKMRHWKQKFQVDAKIVFRKHMQLGICGVEKVSPGDEFTDEMKTALGRHRMQRWWEAGILEIANFDPATRTTAVATEENPKDLGSGWYEVKLPTGETRKVQGRKNAELLLEALDQ